MITDLLPRYYEANGDNPTYVILRSIMIDGHEMAWMEYSGTVQYDLLEQGRAGETYDGRGVYCECDFTENVGWKVKGGQRFSLDGKKKCLARKAGLHLRHLELRREYYELLKTDDMFGGEFVLQRNIPVIILDLIEKVKNGEFIGEEGSGAQFWGGYFYLQTVAAITGSFVGHLWKDVYELMAEKKIGLDGAVIKPYREPPPPMWEEFVRFEDTDGWVGTASLPGHRQMASEWKLEVLNQDGKEVYSLIPGLKLLHDPVFGPDVEDVTRAKTELQELIATAKNSE